MAFSPKLRSLIDFIEFNHEFREVIRVARAPNSKRYENDAEHSYQLASVAWYLIEADNLKLDRELCLTYALAHDLVEVYAGDTYIFDKNKDNHLSKVKREREAIKSIKKRFPKFKTLIHTIERYERKADNESRFIYALDKLIPPIQIYLEKGKLWREKNVSLEQIIENKTHKIALSFPVEKYWREFLEIIRKEEKKLFHK